jgi:AraC-like DNA-binding protein
MSRPLPSVRGPKHWPTGLPGVSLFEEVESTHAYRVWHENWYCFCLVSGGAGEVRYRGRTLEFNPGHAFAFAPGEFHETRRIYQPGTYRVLMIAADAVSNRAQQEEIAEAQLPMAFHAGTRVFGELSRLTQALTGATVSPLERELVYGQFLDTLVANDERTTVRNPRQPHVQTVGNPHVVRAVRDLLRDSDDPNLKLADVASALGWSSGYVSRVFSEQGYCPPKTMLRLIRVERARRLLVSDPTRSIQNAALTAGFRAVEKFNVAFRTAWNMSPSEYLTRHGYR